VHVFILNPDVKRSPVVFASSLGFKIAILHTEKNTPPALGRIVTEQSSSPLTSVVPSLVANCKIWYTKSSEYDFVGISSPKHSQLRFAVLPPSSLLSASSDRVRLQLSPNHHNKFSNHQNAFLKFMTAYSTPVPLEDPFSSTIDPFTTAVLRLELDEIYPFLAVGDSSLKSVGKGSGLYSNRAGTILPSANLFFLLDLK